MAFDGAVCVLPCIGCNTPYDAGGCTHEGSPRRVRPRLAGAAAELAVSVHEAHLHLSLALSLLSFGDAAQADALLDHLVEEPPSGAGSPLDWATSHMERHQYWRVPLWLLADAAERFSRTLPKLSSASLALLSLCVSRRPAAALSLLRPGPLGALRVRRAG